MIFGPSTLAIGELLRIDHRYSGYPCAPAITALGAELMEHINALRGEHNALRTELKVELQTMRADLVRWVFVAVMGQTAMLPGVLYFFMRYVR